jgi:hypothetical protein
VAIWRPYHREPTAISQLRPGKRTPSVQ